MSFQSNISIKSGNKVSISGSLIEATGSFYGSTFSGTIGHFTSVSASSLRINNEYNLPTSDGASGQVLSTDGLGNLSFSDISFSPGGVDTNIQFNKNSEFSGSSNLTYNYDTGVLSGTLSSFTQVSASYIDLGYPSEIAEHEQGRLYYDDSNNKLKVQTEISSSAEGITEISLGQQLAVRVKNASGATLNKGKIVRIVTSVGNSDTPSVSTASYDAEYASADTLAMMVNTTNANDNGYAIIYGILTGINTSAYSVGDMLYLSSSGDFTTTIPQSPLHEVRIGQVVRSANNGTIYVKIQNGYETDELHDVLFSNKSEGDLISWDNSTGVWKNTKILNGSYIIDDPTPPTIEFSNSFEQLYSNNGTAEEIASTQVIKYNNKHYIFAGYPLSSPNGTESGGVRYITSSDNGATWSSATTIPGNSSYDRIGRDVEIIENNGTLYLFASGPDIYESPFYHGVVQLATSSDGVSWSSFVDVKRNTTGYQGFGSSMKALVDSDTGVFNLYVGASIPGYSSTSFVMHLTSSDNGSTWSSGYKIVEKTDGSLLGASIDALVDSDGNYHLVASAPNENNERGSIYVLTSSNGTQGSWSSPIKIHSSSYRSSNYGNGLGARFANIREYDNTLYVFASHAWYDTAISNVGALDMIVCQNNKTWTDTDYTAGTAFSRIYTGSVSSDVIGGSYGESASGLVPANKSTFDAIVADDGIYWSLGSSEKNVNSITNNGELAIGKVVSQNNYSTLLTHTTSSANYGLGGMTSLYKDTDKIYLAFTNKTSANDYGLLFTSASITQNTFLDVKGNTIISGNLTVTNLTVTNTITELSTRRIKKDIRSLGSQLETITKLNPVSYTRKDNSQKEYGFIFEEVREVYPEFVRNEGVSYSKMVSVLVSAVKELKEKVEVQQKEIEQLKNTKQQRATRNTKLKSNKSTKKTE